MLLRRTRGGAVLFERNDEEKSTAIRMTENKDKKEKLARLVLPVLSDSKTLFFDSSSTVSVLAKNFPYEYRTIITTGLNSALILSEKESVSVIIPGGSVSYESNSTAGSLTLKQLSQFNPDCAVFSCGAVYGDQVSEASLEQCEIKKQMFALAKKKVLLADSSKMGKKLSFSFARLDDFDYFITDAQPSAEVLSAVERVRIIYK